MEQTIYTTLTSIYTTLTNLNNNIPFLGDVVSFGSALALYNWARGRCERRKQRKALAAVIHRGRASIYDPPETISPLNLETPDCLRDHRWAGFQAFLREMTALREEGGLDHLPFEHRYEVFKIVNSILAMVQTFEATRVRTHLPVYQLLFDDLEKLDWLKLDKFHRSA